MQKRQMGAFTVAFAAALAGAWNVSSRRHTQDQEALLARAAISVESATGSARAAVPGGTLSDWEIEEEDGRLIYSFVFEVGNQIREVEIDANTGELVPTEAEDENEVEDERDQDDRK